MLFVHRLLRLPIALAVATWSFAAAAQETPTQAPPGVKIVEGKEVQDLQAKGAVLVDTRRAGEYAEGSIKED